MGRVIYWCKSRGGDGPRKRTDLPISTDHGSKFLPVNTRCSSKWNNIYTTKVRRESTPVGCPRAIGSSLFSVGWTRRHDRKKRRPWKTMGHSRTEAKTGTSTLSDEERGYTNGSSPRWPRHENECLVLTMVVGGGRDSGSRRKNLRLLSCGGRTDDTWRLTGDDDDDGDERSTRRCCW